MRPAVCVEDNLAIPAEVGELEAFRRWSYSESFPERGRIDYLAGTIEVDMCPEELQSHGALKSELVSYVQPLVKATNFGQVFVDRGRLCHPGAGLSSEPDILVISLEMLRDGRSRYVSGSTPERKIEVEGSAALVVEVVSDSSAGKDKLRLPPLYAAAGVEELWLADARTEMLFQIQNLEEGTWVPAAVDGEGFTRSRILQRWLRLRREPWELPGTWSYFVDDRLTGP
jgi:Uma2 family endonuclease